MNKSELIAAVNKLPDDIEFLSPKDDEGNGYRWLTGVSVEYIRKDEAESWEVESVLSEDDVVDDYTPEEVELLLHKVAIIW